MNQWVVVCVTARGDQLRSLLPQPFQLGPWAFALRLRECTFICTFTTLERRPRLHTVVRCVQSLASTSHHLVLLRLSEIVEVFVFGGGEWVCGLGSLLLTCLLLPLTVGQLILQHRKLHLELIHLLLFSVLVLLLS